jgi:glycosyltransferase involved in cell wall biosynthesis
VRVLHVSRTDLAGQAFNGYDLMSDLRGLGIEGRQAVLQRLSSNPGVFSVLEGPTDEDLHDILMRAERRHSMDGLLFPWGRPLADSPAFREADVVHYHLIHGGTLSLMDMPRLARARPSVWTLHDPWIMTGHCVHPMTCDKWLTGCVGCRDLGRTFPLETDNANRMWTVKRDVMAAIDIDVVVASDFMLDLVRRSPITAKLWADGRVHLIPFGIKVSDFLPDQERASSRRSLGIPEDDYVILFRSTDSGLKGQEFALDALGSGPPSRSTTVLTVDQTGLIEHLSGDYGIRERGWIHDRDEYARVLSACDILLMPSPAESFGLMALEAMAAGRPVVCFEGTAVASLTRAPECGVAVPVGDAMALRRATDALMADPVEAQRRGDLGRRIAQNVYAHNRYLRALKSLYEESVARRR